MKFEVGDVVRATQRPGYPALVVVEVFGDSHMLLARRIDREKMRHGFSGDPSSGQYTGWLSLKEQAISQDEYVGQFGVGSISNCFVKDPFLTAALKAQNEEKKD